jgi:glycosyltransferase involved in cell wall biosynthesis
MRIVMVLSCFYPMVGGGERQAQRLAARLVARGLDVCVLTRRYRSLARFELIDGVPVYRIPIGGQGPVQALTFTLGALGLLARQDVRASIVHCHQSSLGIAPIAIAALAKRAWDCRVIVKFMGARVIEMMNTRTWPIRRWLLRQADAFVVTNEETRLALGSMGMDVRTHCLPNGVDVQRFQPLEPGARRLLRRTWPDLPPEALLALYVGRLEPVKGVDVLLRAWARLVGRETGRIPVLALVGDGSQREHLARLSRELGIDRSVRFVGFSDQISDWLNSADLFVLPSRSEGLSNALLEAMACGLPTVATTVGGAPEAVEHGVNGLLVPADDDAALADALLQLIRDSGGARQLGESARRTTCARYSMEAMVDRYVKLYAELSESAGPRRLGNRPSGGGE